MLFTLTFSNGTAITWNTNLISNIYWKQKTVRIAQTDGQVYEFAYKPEFEDSNYMLCTNYTEFLNYIAGSIDVPSTHCL
jgi:hypothetical protein